MSKNSVFVLDTNRKPCNPTHPAVARKLLTQAKAAVDNYFEGGIKKSTEGIKN